MVEQRPSIQDPAFWVVIASFVLFLAIAFAVFRYSKNGSHWALRATHPKETATPSISPPLRTMRFTINARSTSRWIYFNLTQEKIVHPRFVSSLNWDLAFRRYHLIANGGVSNLAAQGGILDLGPVGFRQVSAIPKTPFHLNTRAPNGRDPENLAIRHWYNYDYASHILTPTPRTYLIRTPDSHYFALRILNYYCPQGESGCLTFEYYKIR